MIALVATLLIAVYVLGPDLIARWMLGFVVPRKNLVHTKSEEIARGVLWASIPLVIAWLSRHYGFLAVPRGSKFDVQTFFSGIYSESFFLAHRQAFFAAAESFLRLNFCLLLRLYLIVIVGSIAFNCLIGRYGTLRHWLTTRNKFRTLTVLSVVILPRISEWHVILSSILLPSREMNIAVDIMTKDGILYQGTLTDKVIAGNGNLQSITLGTPRRFRRGEFLEARKNSPGVRQEDYWTRIPGELFVVVASVISTLNVRYIPSVRDFGAEFQDVAAALSQLAHKVSNLQTVKKE